MAFTVAPQFTSLLAPSMTSRLALILLLILPFSPAQANDTLDRIESISEQMTAAMFDAMLDEFKARGIDTSSLAKVIPDTSWDEPLRDAGRCVVDRFTDTVGADKLAEMVDALEARLPAVESGGMQAIEDMQSFLPEGVSEADAAAINEACGMTALMQQKLMSPAFMSEVMSLMSNQ